MCWWQPWVTYGLHLYTLVQSCASKVAFLLDYTCTLMQRMCKVALLPGYPCTLMKSSIVARLHLYPNAKLCNPSNIVARLCLCPCAKKVLLLLCLEHVDNVINFTVLVWRFRLTVLLLGFVQYICLTLFTFCAVHNNWTLRHYFNYSLVFGLGMCVCVCMCASICVWVCVGKRKRSSAAVTGDCFSVFSGSPDFYWATQQHLATHTHTLCSQQQAKSS